jgi:hypothetical protein
MDVDGVGMVKTMQNFAAGFCAFPSFCLRSFLRSLMLLPLSTVGVPEFLDQYNLEITVEVRPLPLPSPSPLTSLLTLLTSRPPAQTTPAPPTPSAQTLTTPVEASDRRPQRSL